ncbi:MAG: ABC transporter permease, partial [Actinomycetia bacterium]|nr:ABC transporter permease [Actinomycetes bacterium]
PVDGVPFILWLSVGMVAWYFMSDMLTAGMNVYRRYPYLVNKVRFPLSVISSFFALSSFFVYLMSTAVIVAFMLAFRVPVTIYALQLPVVAVLMFVFFVFWSILMAPLATLSKDFGNLMKSLTTPMFWLSGVLFSVANIRSHTIQTLLHFNPVTFFVTSVRASLCENYWIWNQPTLLLPFAYVAIIVVILALRTYARLSREVADVL